MTKATFHMLALLRSGPRPAGDLIGFVQRLAGEGPPSPASLYRQLKVACDRGWVVREGGVRRAGRGRPGHTYRLTARGDGAVEAEALRLRSIVAMVLPHWPAPGS